MNNNRGNNRRRGRGSNRQQGGQQLNRIDSRARGNAPQMLEKYRKLAHDAHLNGDRVTEEYNLQFADHYFRVIADQRQRQEESRQQRSDPPRWQDNNDPYRDDFEAGDDGSDDTADYARPEREAREPREPRGERGDRSDRGDRAPRHEREPRAERSSELAENAGGDDQAGGEGERSIYEPVENPFVREARPPREAREPREPRGRRPRRDSRGEGDVAEAGVAETPSGFDPQALPPAISISRDADADVEPVAEDAPAKPRRRTRRKPSADEAGDTVEAVG